MHCNIVVDLVWQKKKIHLSAMAVRKPGVIALFDVDGTLTAPRKVLIFISFGYCSIRLFFYEYDDSSIGSISPIVILLDLLHKIRLQAYLY